MGFFPLIRVIAYNGGANIVSITMVDQLQAINLLVTEVNNTDECEYLTESVYAWGAGITAGNKAKDDNASPYLLYLYLEPRRCPAGSTLNETLITSIWCSILLDLDYNDGLTQQDENLINAACAVWTNATREISDAELAERGNIRIGAIQDVNVSDVAPLTLQNGTVIEEIYRTAAKYNHTVTISTAAFASFILQCCLLVCVLGGLTVLRGDAIVLVLGPLRRMLKIVARCTSPDILVGL